MSDLKFSVVGDSLSATQFIGQSRQFTLIVDDSKDLSGSDANANPLEYILAGFAGTANVIGHSAANELGFTIKNLKIEVSGELLPKPSLYTNQDASFKSIHVNFIPECNASIIDLAKWLQIVEERCPIKDSLQYKTALKISVEKEFAAKN
ncbi:putative OsmC-like protein [Winogradskyella epiphytica]|uniref:Putative OsmC-like protein n=1 Tax=Winogradskyella epiphytica TaxID=262005 RepID=A0A2V4WYS0_9FLAO|nr:OsmC family protein [Winogradskyella epiphytica]PYE82806.1 putative OsmC-like protein [Winogradskyella epiphytica]GGW53763.1 osmotically inducible protein C [Winogradskyella epiphytica]